MTGPTLVLHLVVTDLGQVWEVEGDWEVVGASIDVEALRHAALWLEAEARALELDGAVGAACPTSDGGARSGGAATRRRS